MTANSEYKFEEWARYADEDQQVADITLKEGVLYLTQYYIETRYPGDIPAFSMADAEKAVNAARHIKEFVLKKIEG